MTESAQHFDGSTDAFLAWEARQPERWERLNGVVRMMVGASFNHNRLCFALASALRGFAPQSCDVFIESAKLRIGSDILYPDVMVVCPRPRGGDSVTDSAVIVAEVESPSNTLSYQRRKLALYKSLPGLQAILHLSQTEIFAELYRRDGEIWRDSQHVGADAVLDLSGCSEPLALGPLYERVDWESSP